jgi:3(or 17)beta-hydroxysteroid dehydrogenase
MTNRIKNKIALITGASSGIGAATAKLFSAEGAVVYVADIDDEKGQQLVADIGATYFHLDVAQENEWSHVIDEIILKHGHLDILVNNAGISFAKPLTEMSLSEWRKVMAINLDGVFLGTKFSVTAMQKTGGGRIVNVSSASGITASPIASAYCASKGGVRLFTKAAALECAKKNILINSIHPAAVDTPMWDKSEWWPNFEKEMGGREKALQALSQTSPMGRMATADEIAKGILFLVSDDASYMTGSELIIDGGYTAQ